MRTPRNGRERGAALVEFALVVPLLAMFLFGIVQFGLAYDKKQSINSAAREGARAAAIPVTTVDGIESAVEDSFQGLATDDVPDTTVLVVAAGTNIEASYGGAQTPCDGRAGDTVVVRSEVQHVLTIPFFGAPTVTLVGEGEFRCERS